MTARRRALALALAFAGCAGRQFLDAPLPASCARTYDACRAALAQRAWQDSFGTDDPALRAYVRGVVARLARVTALRDVPDVALGHGPDAEVVGGQIEIGIDVIARLDSEAELAGILAHELAHVEARGDTGWDATSGTDDETIADERAVTLLARAGYPPGAFATALAALPGDHAGGDRHPPTPERIARARVLAAQLPAGGDDRRAALLAAIDGRASDAAPMVFIHGDAIEAQSLEFHDADPLRDGHGLFDPGLMIVVLPDRDIAVGAPNVLAATEPPRTGTWELWPVGPAGAAAIASVLASPHRRAFAIGTATLGSSPAPAGSSLGRAINATIDGLARLGTDFAIAVLATPAGGVAVTYDGPDGLASLERWLARFRRPTAAERAGATPHRIRLTIAPRTATLRELVATCPDPARAAEVELHRDRIVRRGERFKCVVR